MQHVFIISELAQFFQAELIHEKTHRISLRNCLTDILYEFSYAQVHVETNLHWLRGKSTPH